MSQLYPRSDGKEVTDIIETSERANTHYGCAELRNNWLGDNERYDREKLISEFAAFMPLVLCHFEALCSLSLRFLTEMCLIITCILVVAVI
jgi:hypothetical protein